MIYQEIIAETIDKLQDLRDEWSFKSKKALDNVLTKLREPQDPLENLAYWGLAQVTVSELANLETQLSRMPAGLFKGKGPVPLQAVNALKACTKSLSTFLPSLEARKRLDECLQGHGLWTDQAERFSKDPATAAVEVINKMMANWEPAIRQMAEKEGVELDPPGLTPAPSALETRLAALESRLETQVEDDSPVDVERTSTLHGLESLRFVRFEPGDEPDALPRSFLCSRFDDPEATSIYLKIATPDSISKTDLLVMKEQFEGLQSGSVSPVGPGGRQMKKILQKLRVEARAPDALETVDKRPSEILGKVRLDLVQGHAARTREASLVQVLINQLGHEPKNKPDGVREDAQEFFLRVLTEMELKISSLALVTLGPGDPQAVARVLESMSQDQLVAALGQTQDPLLKGIGQMAQMTPQLMSESRKLEQYLLKNTEGPRASEENPTGESAVDCAIRLLARYASQEGIASGLEIVGVGIGHEVPGDLPGMVLLQWPDDDGIPALYVKGEKQPSTLERLSRDVTTTRETIRVAQQQQLDETPAPKTSDSVSVAFSEETTDQFTDEQGNPVSPPEESK